MECREVTVKIRAPASSFCWVYAYDSNEWVLCRLNYRLQLSFKPFVTVNFLTGRWTFMIWQIKLVIKELDFFSFMTKHKIMPHCMAENKRNIADVFVEP